MFLEIDKCRVMNFFNFEIKVYIKEWKVIFKSDSFYFNFFIIFIFEK